MKNILYEMRPNDYAEGLKDLIYYVNQFYDTKNMTMIEIGSYAGESTLIFAEHFKKIICIDPYKNDYDKKDPAINYMELNNVYDIFINRIKEHKNIELIKKSSNQAFKSLKKINVDFVYIDGLHTYIQVKKDIENYSKIIKNGFISGHDYHENWHGVIKAVNETIGNPDKLFKDTSWIKSI